MLEFLFSNPIILIILIAVISSLLKKKKNPNQPKWGQPQAPKPIWKEVIREVKEEWLEEKKQIPKKIQEAKSALPSVDDSKSKENSERKRISELKRLQREYEEKQRGGEVESHPHTAEKFPIPKAAKTVPVAFNNTISDSESPIYNKEMIFSKQELIHGIIMSEVLGPPRSKRRLKR